MSVPFFTDGSTEPVRDKDWVRKAFMVRVTGVEKEYLDLSTKSAADTDYTDTRIGGNWAINNPPAYTRYADPRSTGITIQDAGNTPVGMGHFYKEQLDQPAQLIHLRFGVPDYRGLISFFGNFYDPAASLLARQGRVPISFYLGKVIGLVVSVPFIKYILIGKVVRFLLGRSGSSYYNLKPTMHTYWNRVNYIATQFAISMGLTDKGYLLGKIGTKELESDAEDDAGNVNTDLIKMAHQAAPMLFKAKGGVDVYAMAMRVQDLANMRRESLVNIQENSNSLVDLKKRLQNYLYNEKLRDNNTRDFHEDVLKPIQTGIAGDPAYAGEDKFEKALKAEAEKSISAQTTGGAVTADQSNTSNANGSDNVQAQEAPVSGAAPKTATRINEQGQTVDEAGNPVQSTTAPGEVVPMYDYVIEDPNTGEKVQKAGWLHRWVSENKSAFNQGFQFVSFKVNHTGSVSASFTNSTREAEISSRINGISQAANSMRASFAQGTTGIPGLDQVVQMGMNVLQGVADGMQLSGLMALGGSGYVDIPEHWDTSSADLPTESYTIHLRSPFGNRLSRFINLFIPLSMLLAGALPIATGKKSFTSPFICELYSEGRCTNRLAMFKSLRVEHGTGNLGFNISNQILNIDISFEIASLNKALYAPIDTGASMLNPIGAIIDDDSAFNDYIGVLSSLSMADQTMPVRKAARNVARYMAKWDSFFSVGNFTMGYWDSLPGRALISLSGLTPWASQNDRSYQN